MSKSLLERLQEKRNKLIIKINKLDTRISRLGGNLHLKEIMPPHEIDTHAQVENHVAIDGIINNLKDFRKRSDHLIKLEFEDSRFHMKLDIELSKEYQCEKCKHLDSEHESEDKGQCLVEGCICEGL